MGIDQEIDVLLSQLESQKKEVLKINQYFMKDDDLKVKVEKIQSNQQNHLKSLLASAIGNANNHRCNSRLVNQIITNSQDMIVEAILSASPTDEYYHSRDQLYDIIEQEIKINIKQPKILPEKKLSVRSKRNSRKKKHRRKIENKK